ncbi:TatD family hydrolase [Peptostreptococcus canis]|uniref:TatD family hydrolase n=1 Tax=Peptostreptococcus canis TaxID=1159213 RepID=A0ABR6TJM5_9FIRM|nr:TatD family hydrolase [Peptostreptococcus canis]MBC2575600.1 TatD family hydrolase [Peptostreptococcus canis]MBP1997198.1 TatD DNase family protein [Peptostreptococcus canis]
MNKFLSKENILYDFHTHIGDYQEFISYYNQNIIPVINIRSKEEFLKIESFYERMCFESLLDNLDSNENKFINKSKKSKYGENLLKINENCGSLFLSTGVHPFDSDKFDKKYGQDYELLLKKSNLIGEIGMDGSWCEIDKNTQKKKFLKSLEIGKKLNMPIVLHTKGMEKDIFNIISNFDLTYIVHWYSCNNFNEEFIDLGCYFTFGPAIFEDNNIRKLAKGVSVDRILIETDGVDALEWLFKRKFNHKELRGILINVIEEIANLRSETFEYIYSNIIKNSERLLKGL